MSLDRNATINELVVDSWKTADDKGWHDTERSVGELIALVHAELSEALEEFRKGYDPSEIYFGPDGKPEGIPIELADVFIRIGDMCGVYEIDLAKAIAIKSEYNESREYRHGNKVI